MSTSLSTQTHLKEPKDLTGKVRIEQQDAVFLGNYSWVYIGRYKGERVAVKVIKLTGKPESMKRKIKRECMVWATADHPNIQPFYGLARDQEFSPFGALISPWSANGDASRYLSENGKKMSVSARISLVRDPQMQLPALPDLVMKWKGVIRGLVYLHEHDPVIVHGDLKPGNVLIDGTRNPRICDFGLAQVFLEEGRTDLTTTSEHTGTARYLAPELVNSDQNVYPTTASDVYALGCLGLEFIYLQAPYFNLINNFRGRIFTDIRQGFPPARQQPRCEWPSCRAWPLISDIWNADPWLRPSAFTAAYTLERISFTIPANVIRRIVHFVSRNYINSWDEALSMASWGERSRCLLNLCMVSKMCRAFTIPFLYEDIRLDLRGGPERQIHLLDMLNSQGHALAFDPMPINGVGSYTQSLLLFVEEASLTPSMVMGVQHLLYRMPMLRYLQISPKPWLLSRNEQGHISVMEINYIASFFQGSYFLLLPAWSHIHSLCINITQRDPGSEPGRTAMPHTLLPNLLEITVYELNVADYCPTVTIEVLMMVSLWIMPRLVRLYIDFGPGVSSLNFLGLLRGNSSIFSPKQNYLFQIAHLLPVCWDLRLSSPDDIPDAKSLGLPIIQTDVKRDPLLRLEVVKLAWRNFGGQAMMEASFNINEGVVHVSGLYYSLETHRFV